ncbi:ABC transporter permease [Streptomyces sp. V4-01]|uniref:ABC transporter permease n=1 Tax=Actinacidiphila polyblastidii TaxID=3110430 RepID=A0ABU7PM01_9ACTN|nr:ABC transporter permease [Streptomyces sp. V4-01]
MASRRYLVPLLLVPLTAAAALWLFAWPVARAAPRGLPVGVSGPQAAVVSLEGRLAVAHGSTSFAFHRYDGERSARHAIADRDVYGAVVMSPAGTTLLTASAASPAVANLLQQAAAGPAAGHPAQVRVVDVVPLPATDPRGIAFTSSLLPLLVAGIACAHLAPSLAPTLGRRVGVLLGAAVLTGLAATALAQSWLAYLGGNWAADAGVVALITLAVSSLVSGLAALGRTAGLLAGAMLMVLIGNATSGATTAPELLPTAIGWIGRLLPPGAGAGALRGTAFFDGHGIGRDITVLAVWIVLGLLMTVLGARRAQRSGHPHGAHALGAFAEPAAGGTPAAAVSTD